MRPVLISGIQPTGNLHLGNYLGALKNFVELQNSGKYECYFFIADLHSMTEDYEPKEKSKQILNIALDYLAVGLDPKKSIIFQQSAIPAHAELMWILNTITPMGELRRMTQFKDKSWRSKKESITTMLLQMLEMYEKLLGRKFAEGEKENFEDELLKRIPSNELLGGVKESANFGLFDYPVLMAADILLYNTSVVPVGHDQLQHLELTRTLARKFNTKFGKTFIEPKPLLTEVPRLMSLDDPTKKMSKSRSTGCVFIDDAPEIIRKKIMSAVTDSMSEVGYDEEKRPAIANLLLLYSAMSDVSIPKVVAQYKGKGYADFKRGLADTVIEALAPFQKKKKEMAKKINEVKKTLEEGNEKANGVAKNRIKEVKTKVGLTI